MGKRQSHYAPIAELLLATSTKRRRLACDALLRQTITRLDTTIHFLAIEAIIFFSDEQKIVNCRHNLQKTLCREESAAPREQIGNLPRHLDDEEGEGH
jgi:hypothetical protein